MAAARTPVPHTRESLLAALTEAVHDRDERALRRLLARVAEQVSGALTCGNVIRPPRAEGHWGQCGSRLQRRIPAAATRPCWSSTWTTTGNPSGGDAAHHGQCLVPAVGTQGCDGEFTSEGGSPCSCGAQLSREDTEHGQRPTVLVTGHVQVRRST